MKITPTNSKATRKYLVLSVAIMVSSLEAKNETAVSGSNRLIVYSRPRCEVLMHREAATITNLPNFRSVLPGHFSPTRECVTISPWPTQHADASSRPLSARRARRDFARCLITLPLLLHPPGSFQAPRAFLLYRRVRSNNSMDRLFRRRRVPAIPLTRCWLNTVLSLFVALPALAQTGSVVISQVYGGGGNTGAPLQADFIELFNRSEATV